MLQFKIWLFVFFLKLKIITPLKTAFLYNSWLSQTIFKKKKVCWNPYIMTVFFLMFRSLESLDELTCLVVKLFSEVENKNVPIPEFPEHPFQEEHLRVCIGMHLPSRVYILNVVFYVSVIHCALHYFFINVPVKFHISILISHSLFHAEYTFV